MSESPLVYPKYLSIQTTSFCNAKCIFCPNEEVKHLFPPKVMDEALFRKIIDECGRYRGIERIILYLNNEPLTDANIIERINYAKTIVPWASVHILTNGSLLDDKMQEGLINSKLDWIGISMHGIKKLSVEGAMGLDYDTVFPRLLTFIQKAKEKRNLQEFVMVTFLNHKYLSCAEKDEAINFWRSQGLSRISFFDAPISRAGNSSLLPKVWHSRICGCRSIWANEMIHIVEDGGVVLCCMDWRREVALGNIKGQSIREVWNSPAYAAIRDKRDGKDYSENNFICKRCEEAIVAQDEFTAPATGAVFAPGAQVNSGQGGSRGIVLVNVPPWQTKMPPLGVAYLSSYLRSNGVKTQVIDLNVKLFNKAEAKKKYFWEIATINNFTPAQLGERFCCAFSKDIKNFINEILGLKVRLIGLSTTIASLNVAVYLAHQIKQKDPSKIIILGGPGVFWNTQLIDPQRLIDIFVIAEGELSLLEVIRRFEKTGGLADLAGIPGTIVYFDKQYHLSSSVNPLKDLDQIPTVDFSEFELEEYNAGSQWRPLPILTSRGCINRCSFCIDHKMITPFRSRSPQKVFDELKYYSQEFGVQDFEFNDLLCNGNLKQLEALCDLIIKEKLALRWHSYAAIRSGMTIELFRKMKSSGCLSLCYGMESASDLVLKKMNKTFDCRTAEQVVRDTHNAKILTKINIIIGHPGESEKEFQETCQFVKRNKDFIDEITNVSTCFLMPETELIRNPEKFGIYFKQGLAQRLKNFYKKQPAACNYRKFYARPDNSPHTRAMRLRRMLFLISKLGIPHVIVNRVKEDDPGLDKLFRAAKQKPSVGISNSLLKVAFDPNIKVAHIYFKGQKLTSDVGLNTSFYIRDKWFDSSAADWEFKPVGRALFIRVMFPELAISQEWLIRLHKGSLSWKVKTYFQKEIEVSQQKIGIVFSDRYSSYAAGASCLEFPPMEEGWRDVDLLRGDQVDLIAGKDLPRVNLAKERHTKEIDFIQLQNFPFSFSSRMINFCLFDASVKDVQGQSRRIFKKGQTITDSLKLTLGAK